MSTLKTTALASSLALALAACGSDADEPMAENATAGSETSQTAEYDPMTRDYTL